MKKITSLILALVMALSLTTAAFAADPVQKDVTGTVKITTDTAGTSDPSTGTGYLGSAWNIDVKAGRNDADFDATAANAVDPNYYVVVSWTVNSSLTYQVDANSYTWAFYKDATGTTAADTAKDTVLSAGFKPGDAKWAGDATVNVKITNWSNAKLTATYGWEYATVDTTNVTAELKNFTITGISNGTENVDTIESAAKSVIDGLTAGGSALLTTAGTTNGDAGHDVKIAVASNTEGAIAQTCAIGHVTVTINKA